MAKNPEPWNQPIHHIDKVIVKFSTPYWIPSGFCLLTKEGQPQKRRGPQHSWLSFPGFSMKFDKTKFAEFLQTIHLWKISAASRTNPTTSEEKSLGQAHLVTKVFLVFKREGRPRMEFLFWSICFYPAGACRPWRGRGCFSCLIFESQVKDHREHWKDWDDTGIFVPTTAWYICDLVNLDCESVYIEFSEGSFHNTLLALEKDWCKAGEMGWWLRNIDSIVCVCGPPLFILLSTNSQAHRGHLQPLLFKTTLAGDTHKNTHTLRLECLLSTQHHTQHNVHIHKPIHAHTHTYTHTLVLKELPLDFEF